MFNVTRFDLIARTLVPGWPITLEHVMAELQTPTVAMHSYLTARSCAHECGWNQWAPDGRCVFLAPFERTNTLFVNVVFSLFICIIVIAGITFFVKKMHAVTLDEWSTREPPQPTPVRAPAAGARLQIRQTVGEQ
jgi:hypothetical protein